MRLLLSILAIVVLVGSAGAADIAKEEGVFVEGVPRVLEDQLVGADGLIVEVLAATFTDLAPVYQGALGANGVPADIVYDPLGAWDPTGYGVVVMNTSDNWWDTYDYAPDLANAASYIEGGGCFWIIGQDFLYGGAAFGAGVFVQTYCGVSSVMEDVNFGDTALAWFGTSGGLLDGMAGDQIACFEANPYFTDDVTPTAQGIITWESLQWGPAEGGAQGDALFSTVEFGCDAQVEGIVGRLLEFCGPGPIPTRNTTWGQIKNLYR